MPGLKHYTYFQRLNRLDLESLELPLRHLRQDLIFIYKLVFGLVDVNVHDFFRCFWGLLQSNGDSIRNIVSKQEMSVYLLNGKQI